MRPILVAGLDIGSTKTCAVILEVNREAEGSGLRVLGIGQTRTGGVRREVVTDIEETTESVRKALHEAELMAGVKPDRVYVGIAGDHIDARVSTGVVAVGGGEIGPSDVERVHEVARSGFTPAISSAS
ncbi:MAG: cell division FtsA domain-containing protein, partial [Gemmatimonadota bacterium]